MPTELSLETERTARVRSDIRALKCELEAFTEHNGSLPSGLGSHGYLPKDSWHRNYLYRYPGTVNRSGYDLFSAGPDGQANTPDDDWGE